MYRHLVIIASFLVVASEQFGNRIVGGDPTTIERHPYQVSLRDRRLRHLCGGTIATTRTVVTAAHCVEGFAAGDVTVVAGSSVLAPAERPRKLTRILIHPQYDPRTLNWDAALLFVATVLSWTPAIQPIPLAFNEAAPGQNASITGWGFTQQGGPGSMQLRLVYVSIVDRSTCNSNYAPVLVTPIMICAGVPGGGKGPCHGDSGGALVIDGQAYGIMSWGQGCARPNKPGVYTNVASIRSWVMNNSV